jgi:hypothetical protein
MVHPINHETRINHNLFRAVFTNKHMHTIARIRPIFREDPGLQEEPGG